jgi:3-oxocholest-4-en-26-oate---CoA ligase
VALYLHNCSEYLEASFAAFKVGLVPVNTNYRYADNELVYLWSNADAVVVVFHGHFAERIEGLRARVPNVRSWLWVDDRSGPCPVWATPYEDAAAAGDGNRTSPPWGRSGDDICMLYTGGTTGMPKGVMWRQDDLFARMNENSLHRYAEANGLAGIRADLEAYGPGATMMPACPLMHGTGWFTALECLSEGGRVVTLTSLGLDPDDLLDTVEREQVNWLVIVGDAFSRPIIGALDEHRDRWNLSSLVGIISSGVMWSKESKKGLLAHHPTMMLMDAFSSSEALGMGSSVSSGSSAVHTAEFTLGSDVRVFGPDSNEVKSGSGQIGVLAIGGRNPLGYYKDDAKTNETFRTYDGIRYSVPGDYATVGEDGKIQLLGRGSVVINTGGEKVFPEEVEEVVKTFPGVADAVAVGVPNERFGQRAVRRGSGRGGGTEPRNRLGFGDSRTDQGLRARAVGRLQGPAPDPFRRFDWPFSVRQGGLQVAP